MKLAPVIDQKIFQDQALVQKERETRTGVAGQEQFHFSADLPMIPSDRLFQHGQMGFQLLVCAKGDPADSGQHLPAFIRFPVGAGKAGELKGFQSCSAGNMRAGAHVDIIALLIKVEFGILWQVVHMLQLIDFTALRQQFFRLFSGQGKRAEGQIFFADPAHLFFNGRKIGLSNLVVTRIDIIIESGFGGRTIRKMGAWIQAAHCLSHDVCGAVAQNMQFFARSTFSYGSVVTDYFHTDTNPPFPAVCGN